MVVLSSEIEEPAVRLSRRGEATYININTPQPLLHLLVILSAAKNLRISPSSLSLLLQITSEPMPTLAVVAHSLTELLPSTLATFTPFDWLVAALVLWSIIRGLLRGFIRELFALVALVIGSTVAAWNYITFASWLARWIPQPVYASLVAFLLLATVITIAVLLVGRLVRSAAHLVGLGLLDRLGGALFGLARASLLGAAILLACTTFLPPQPWLQRSVLAPSLLKIAHVVAILAPADLQQRLSGLLTRVSP